MSKKWVKKLDNFNAEIEKMESLFDFDKLINNKNEIPTDILAFIGDSFFNLIATFESIKDGRIKTEKAFKEGIKFKRASGQRKFLNEIEPLLNSEEQELVKKGLNSKGATKRGNDYDYRHATAFEVLIGYLFVNKRWARLNTLFSKGF